MRESSVKFDFHISLLKRNTIQARSRTTRKLMCTHPCPLYHMHVLKVILIRGAMRQPVSCAEGLSLANSLITGTVSQIQLMEWKKQHLRKKLQRRNISCVRIEILE
jgi:hypothetical protein